MMLFIDESYHSYFSPKCNHSIRKNASVIHCLGYSELSCRISSFKS